MAHATGNQRKRLLIEPGFQKSFLAYTIGIAISVMLIFFSATRYFFWRFESKGREIGLPDGHIFFRFLADQKLHMDLILLGTSVLITAVVGFYGLYLSNRVAGPIYRLKSYLRKYLANEVQEELRFRKKDYFPELAELVGQSLAKSRNSSPETKKSA